MTRRVFTTRGGIPIGYLGSFAMMNMHTLAMIRFGISRPSLSNTCSKKVVMSVLKTANSPHRRAGLPGCAIITRHAATPSTYPTAFMS